MSYNYGISTHYGAHEEMRHKTTRNSPDGFQIIEECTECKMRFLHDPLIGYPIQLFKRMDKNETF